MKIPVLAAAVTLNLFIPTTVLPQSFERGPALIHH
jgi:hypothetical protein